MGIFSGLEQFGLGKMKNVDVYDDKKQTAEKPEKVVKKGTISEIDALFDKGYDCPVCDEHFTVKAVRVGKVKLASSDIDLRPVYETVDTLKYDAIVCPHCGFGALTRFFAPNSPTQNKMIRAQICSNYKGLPVSNRIYTYDDAIARHKLVLANAVVKRSHTSERAYICLKLAWLIRGKAENGSLSEADKRELKVQEMEFLENAFSGFTQAFSTETMPICGMDELTITYLMAAIAYELERYDEANQWAGRVIVSRSASERIKEKARKLRDMIKEKQANE